MNISSSENGFAFTSVCFNSHICLQLRKISDRSLFWFEKFLAIDMSCLLEIFCCPLIVVPVCRYSASKKSRLPSKKQIDVTAGDKKTQMKTVLFDSKQGIEFTGRMTDRRKWHRKSVSLRLSSESLNLVSRSVLSFFLSIPFLFCLFSDRL